MNKEKRHDKDNRGPESVGARIKHIRSSLNLTQKVFADSLGIVQGFLSALEKGKKSPSNTLLIALQHLYKVNPQWIHSGQGLTFFSPESEKLEAIPLMQELPAEKEIFQIPSRINRYISLPDLPRNSFAYVYSGNYMSPTIRDGDIIIISPDTPLKSGKISLIVGKWGEPLLRRFREVNGEQYFSPDNSDYSVFQPDDSTRILGVVVKVFREIKV